LRLYPALRVEGGSAHGTTVKHLSFATYSPHYALVRHEMPMHRSGSRLSPFCKRALASLYEETTIASVRTSVRHT